MEQESTGTLEIGMGRFHALAEKYGTDKGNHHCYMDFYEFHLGRLVHQPIKLLEIGVANGASVRMWLDIFSDAKIFGLDTYVGHNVDNPRFSLFCGNQANHSDLQAVGDGYKIIIDDGSHRMTDQIISFKYLFQNALAPGGIYVIEDLHSSYECEYQGTPFGGGATVSFLKRLIDGLNYKSYKFDEIAGEISVSYYDKNVESVCFHGGVLSGIVFIYKAKKERE